MSRVTAPHHEEVSHIGGQMYIEDLIFLIIDIHRDSWPDRERKRSIFTRASLWAPKEVVVLVVLMVEVAVGW
jgi:hypothetical protein